MHPTHRSSPNPHDLRICRAPRRLPSRSLPRAGLIVIAAVCCAWVHADSTFNVDTVDDLTDDDTTDGICHTTADTCSLRAAIIQANHPPIGTTIIHVPAGLYRITIPVDTVDDETVGNFNFGPAGGPNQTVISGAGPEHTIIDANALDNAFRVRGPRTVAIEGITIRNGVTSSNGGGIATEGDLTITRCVIENNTGMLGGGIYAGTSSGGLLTVVDSVVRSNTAVFGGGIYTRSVTTLRNSDLDGNRVSDSGGGLYEDNRLTITDSTISNNAANTNGGGIQSSNSTFVYSSSIVGNDADHDRDELGGIGGGAFVKAGSRFVAVNTLFVRNTILDAPISDSCNGTVEVYGMNLLDDVVGCTFSGNGASATGTLSPATVGPLQDNGGPTPTHALLEGSEAIDATASQGCIDETGEQLPADQRGAPRVAGERCDVGAYEFGSITDRIFADGFD